MQAKPTEAGFTLIETLVALAILAIAAIGLVRAAEAHVDSVRGLELRAAAQWVAENRLAELNLPGASSIATDVAMLGQQWHVVTAVTKTDDPDIRKAHIVVTMAAGTGPGFVLDGFVDAGTTTV